MSSWVSGVVNFVAGTTALATPEMAPMIRRSSIGPSPSVSITSASGVPIANSPTPCVDVRPVTVHTTVPGDSMVPTSRNQAGPLATMPATFAMVSTLLMRTGFSITQSTPSLSAGDDSAPWRYGGVTRGNGGRPSSTSSMADSSPNRYCLGPCARRIRTPSSRPGGLDLGDRPDEGVDRRRERLLHRDHDLVGADGVRRDQRSFDHAIGDSRRGWRGPCTNPVHPRRR